MFSPFRKKKHPAILQTLVPNTSTHLHSRCSHLVFQRGNTNNQTQMFSNSHPASLYLISIWTFLLLHVHWKGCPSSSPRFISLPVPWKPSLPPTLLMQNLLSFSLLLCFPTSMKRAQVSPITNIKQFLWSHFSFLLYFPYFFLFIAKILERTVCTHASLFLSSWINSPWETVVGNIAEGWLPAKSKEPSSVFSF